jgi:hypothetical protein
MTKRADPVNRNSFIHNRPHAESFTKELPQDLRAPRGIDAEEGKCLPKKRKPEP